MIRKVLVLCLLSCLAAPAVFANSALRDIAFTSMAVKKNRTAQSRRAVLDNSFDAVSLDLRDSLRDPSVRGKVRSKLRRNWFAKGEWYSPQPRRPYEMPALTMADQNLGVLTRMNVSLQTALAPWKRLLNAASQSSWSSVAIVRTLAG